MSNLFYEQLEKQSNGTDLKEFAIEEIEKIKAELENPKVISMDFFDGLAYAEEIIDKHISKLKGENNE